MAARCNLGLEGSGREERLGRKVRLAVPAVGTARDRTLGARTRRLAEREGERERFFGWAVRDERLVQDERLGRKVRLAVPAEDREGPDAVREDAPACGEREGFLVGRRLRRLPPRDLRADPCGSAARRAAWPVGGPTVRTLHNAARCPT
jgi:hypothetical protein